MYGYGKAEKRELESVCCDAGVMRMVSGTMNGEWISPEVVGNWVNSGVMELEVMKSGVTRRRLPN
jgi:hypothetical protein